MYAAIGGYRLFAIYKTSSPKALKWKGLQPLFKRYAKQSIEPDRTANIKGVSNPFVTAFLSKFGISKSI